MKQLDIKYIALPTIRKKLRTQIPKEHYHFILSRGEYVCKSDADIKRVVKKERQRVDLIVIKCKKASACAALIHIPDIDLFKIGLDSISYLTPAIAKELGKRQIPILLSLRKLIIKSSRGRLDVLKQYRRLTNIISHYNVPVVVSSGAKTFYELRAPENLIALGKFVGLSETQIVTGFTEVAQELWERAIKRRKNLIIMPGVELEEEDKND